MAKECPECYAPCEENEVRICENCALVGCELCMPQSLCDGCAEAEAADNDEGDE